MVLVFDTESYMHDWFFCGVDTETNEEFVFHNEPSKFAKWFDTIRVKEILAAFNLNGYDKHIVNAIYNQKSPIEIKMMSDELIFNKKYPYQKKVNYVGYDIMPEGTDRVSLKSLEAFAGHNIKETSIPFDYPDRLNKEQCDLTIEYCLNDAKEASYYMLDNIAELKGKIQICKMYDLPLTNISRTKAALGEIVLGAKKGNYPLEKPPYVMDYNLVPKNVMGYYNNMGYTNRSFVFPLKDCSGFVVEHSLGGGGIHGVRKSYFSNKLHKHLDVKSFYPQLMTKYKTLSRAFENGYRLQEMLDKRLSTKDKGINYALKILINSVYGISGAEFSDACDKTMAYATTINGQLMLITLMIMIADYAEIVNSNTDGLIVYEHDAETVEMKVGEWQDLTKMPLEIHNVTQIVQKDVNNYYIKIEGEDEPDVRGSYFRQPSKWRCNLGQRGIANVALVKHFQNIPIKKTIMECTELRQFQSIVKLSDNYDSIKYFKDRKSEDVTQAVNRVFAVKNGGEIKKGKNGVYDKVGSVPSSCVIVNEDITSWTPKTLFEKTGMELDYNYYIDFTQKRIFDVMYQDMSDKNKTRMRVNKSILDF